MNEPQFFDLIAARTGLEIRAKDRETATRALEEHARAHGSKNTGEYLALLARDTPPGHAQWRLLAPALTNGESYFWRDRGQFALLESTILPQLLRERAGAVRIWSAGCSGGQEVYSLAMLLADLNDADAGLRAHRATLVGTDINEEALAGARRGVYGDWSFRGVDEKLRARHFERVGDRWSVRTRLRSRVSFEALNLSAPAPQMRDFDLIVCRNVLIYLTPAAVDNALKLFAAALREGGILLTGHAELSGHDLNGLTPRSFPESVIYQKMSAPPTSSHAAPVRVKRPPEAPIQVAPMRAQPTPNLALEGVAEQMTRAQKLADGGDHGAAIELCRRAIERDACCARAYLLWAHIEIERGECSHAKTLLKKVLYLAPDEAAGYLEIAALYESENDDARAAVMRAAAAKLRGAG